MKKSTSAIKKPSPRRCGVTIVEYVLIGLVVMIALVGLSLLGGNLGQWLVLLKGDMGKSVSASSAAEAAAATEVAAANAPQGNPAGAPAPAGGGKNAGSNTVCMNGTCITVPPSLAQSSFTIGANGSENLAAMQQMLDVYQQVADMLKNDPNADPYLSQLLTELAQAGHSNANTQSTLLTVNGNFSSSQVSSTIGDFSNSHQQFQTVAAKVEPLLSKLPPDTANLVKNSTAVIEGVMSSVDQATQSGTPDMNAIKQSNIDLTHSESNNICKNGGSPPDCIQ